MPSDTNYSRFSFNWHQWYSIFWLWWIFSVDLGFGYIFPIVLRRTFTWWSRSRSSLSTWSIAISTSIAWSAPVVPIYKIMQEFKLSKEINCKKLQTLKFLMTIPVSVTISTTIPSTILRWAAIFVVFFHFTLVLILFPFALLFLFFFCQRRLKLFLFFLIQTIYKRTVYKLVFLTKHRLLQINIIRLHLLGYISPTVKI